MAIGAAVLLAAAGWYVLRRGDDGPPPLTRAEAAATAASIAEEAVAEAAAAPAPGVGVYAAIAPSLVLIQTDGSASAADEAEGGGQPSADAADPQDGDPIVAAPPQDRLEQSIGTGVVINEAGLILTANHVVDEAESIRVTFADGTEGNAFVVSAEPENDIAVLMADVKPEVIVPAVMGGGVQIGDETYAVGHPSASPAR